VVQKKLIYIASRPRFLQSITNRIPNKRSPFLSVYIFVTYCFPQRLLDCQSYYATELPVL